MTNKNDFKGLTLSEFQESYREIRENAMAPYILPIYVMLDLSGSMQTVCDKALYILSCLKKEFGDVKCPCDTFLILSVIHNCRDKNDVPKIVYSGFIDEFDINDFNAKVIDCYGLTPLVNALEQVNEYGKMLINHLDSVERAHSCPVNIFITDYIENVSDDVRCREVINNLQNEIFGEKKLAIEFVLTDSQAIDMGVKERLDKAISFGGFRCRYNHRDISRIIEALQLSSSTISEDEESLPPRSNIKKYNYCIRKTLIKKMHEYWDHYSN